MDKTVDLPLTIRDGREVVRREVAEAFTKWLGVRSLTFCHLSDEDPLFVTLWVGHTELPTLGRGKVLGPVVPAGRRLSTDSVRCVLRRAAERAGLDPKLCTPHRLRHHYGLASITAGVPVTAVMRAMGHRSLAMTTRYSLLTDGQRRHAFARAEVGSDLRFPGQKQPKLAGAREIEESLRASGTSLSEAARTLFGRD